MNLSLGNVIRLRERIWRVDRVEEHESRSALTPSLELTCHRSRIMVDPIYNHTHVGADGLTRAQYEAMLNSFEVLARLETAKHGRFKFKEDCLAAFGRVG